VIYILLHITIYTDIMDTETDCCTKQSIYIRKLLQTMSEKSMVLLNIMLQQ